MAQISKNILLTDTKQARQEKGSEKGVLFCFWKEIREVNGRIKGRWMWRRGKSGDEMKDQTKKWERRTGNCSLVTRGKSLPGA